MPVHYLDCDNFKESEGLESWTPVGDEFGSSIYDPHQKDDAVLHSGKITSSTSTSTAPVEHLEPKDKVSETPRMNELQGKSFRDREPNRIPVARPGGLKKTATVEDSAEEDKRKSVEVTESTPSPRTVRHFLGNINEKSDAFIRSRKEAMSRNH
ncbi:hypothetical protein Ddye_016668 [Dipteronia dyeriana]|uniref:Uncharacterized protein n=1 Tax=Dipteronia dyeriana TaxID=168575 RepID=A0AAD9U7R9_9ROSI|nr:hypothetical protein Ddye_016668 [Dipteronia dyeriana]